MAETNPLQPVIPVAETSPEINMMVEDLRGKAKASENYSNYLLNQNVPNQFDLFRDNRIALTEYDINKADAYATLSSGDRVARFDNYLPGVDNYERAAQMQTTGEKWWNGVRKFIGKTSNAVIGGTAGIVYGVGNMISQGSLTALYDNDFSNYLNDLDTRMNYRLPNYYTKQEQEKGLGGQMLTANFWSDKVLGGLSFTTGAIASEAIWAYATGGVSLGTTAARWSSKLASLGKIKQGVNGFKKVLKTPLNAAFKGQKAAKNTAIALGKVGDISNTLRFTMTSAGYEASIEALQYKNEAEEDFYNSFTDRNPTSEEIADFENNLQNSTNAVFGFNMGLVGSSNLVTMGKIFNLKNPIKTGIGDFMEKKAFGRGVENVKGTFKAIEATRGQRIARTIFDYGKAPVTEGLYEEAGQGVVSNTAKKWIEHSYDPQKSKENIEMAGLVYESLAEQYGTKEGWVENGVGAIIGMLGGTANVQAGRARQKVEDKFKAEGLNTFTKQVIADRLITANRMNGFAQEAQQEEEKGNIVKSRIASNGVLHSRMNHAYQLGENLEDLIEEARVALDATTVEQFEANGVRPEQIEDFKEETLDAYAKVAQEFKTNRQYAEYMLGRTPLKGGQEVYSAGDKSLRTDNQEALIQAMTWSLSAGQNAAELMGDINSVLGEELGRQQSETLSSISKLKAQTAQVQQDILTKTNQVNKLEEERAKLEKTIVSLQNTPAEDKVKGQDYSTATSRMLELNNSITALYEELEGYAEDINAQQQIGEGIVSAQSLINTRSNLSSLKKMIEGLKETNPRKYQYLSDLVDEYTQAEEIYTSNQQTVNSIQTGKIENLNTWLHKRLNKNASMDVATKEWLIEMLQNYQNNKVETIAEGADPVSLQEYNSILETGIVSSERLEDIAVKVSQNSSLSKREQFIRDLKEQEIEDFLKETPVPTVTVVETEIDKVQQLRDRLKRALRNNMLTQTGELLTEKPTQSEIEEYEKIKDQDTERAEQLREKLGSWRLLDSIMIDEDASIADIVEMISQMEAVIQEQEVKDEITIEDTAEIASEGVDNSTVRYDLAQNTKGSATVQIIKSKGIHKISHMKMNSLADYAGVTKENIKSVNSKGEPVETDLENYSTGTIFYLDNMKVTVGEGNTLELKTTDFQSIDAFKIVIPTSKWTYFDLYDTNGRKIPSDFEENINPELLYEIKPDTDLTIEIADDGFNETLADDKLEKSLKLYVVYKGQAVSTLKATKQSVAPEDKFLLLRKQAAEAFRAGRPFKAKIKASKVFLGSPQLTTENGGVVNIQMNETAVNQVVSTGYLQNGNLTLSRQVKDVDLTYTSGISNDGRKLPVIVVKRGAYNIAYPVTLVKSPSAQADSIYRILDNPTLSQMQKVKAINDRIIATGIAADKRLTEFDEQQIREILDEFEQHQTFVSMEDFSNAQYNFRSLQNDVLVNIDLNDLNQVFSDAKLEVDLSSIEIQTEKQITYENLTEVENRLSEISIALDRDYLQNATTKYVDSQGRVIEDTKYTNVFDEGKVFAEPKSHLEKIANVNALMEAFEERLPNVVRKAVGQETINEIKQLIKKRDFIKSQKTPDQEQVAKIIKDNSCR